MVRGDGKDRDAKRIPERGQVHISPVGKHFSADGAADEGIYGLASTLLVGAEGDLPGLTDAESVRVIGEKMVAAAAAHVSEMIRLDIVWLVAERVEDEAALASLFYAAAVHDAELICETNLECLDSIIRLVPASMAVQWLVAPDATERRVALAAARPVRRMAVSDPSRDDAMERIDKLQEEVARIGKLLGKLAGDAPPLQGLGQYEIQSSNLSGSEAAVHAAPRSFRPMPRPQPVSDLVTGRGKAKSVRQLIGKRRMREQYFPAELFADPAWDMLLDLYAARLEQQMVSVSSLCIAAAVPATTALRWIKTLTDAGLFVREADEKDGRRIFIAMSDKAFVSIERYFEALEE